MEIRCTKFQVSKYKKCNLQTRKNEFYIKTCFFEGNFKFKMFR